MKSEGSDARKSPGYPTRGGSQGMRVGLCDSLSLPWPPLSHFPGDDCSLGVFAISVALMWELNWPGC